MRHRSRIGVRMAPAAFAFALASLAVPTLSQPSGSCPAPIGAADFVWDTLAVAGRDTLSHPLHMDFDRDPQGNVDVYFVERTGRLRRYSAARKQVETLGLLPVDSKGEMGLLGIALDPGFRTNRQLYLYYNTRTNPLDPFRLSRFTLAGNGLDLGSESVLLRIPAAFHEFTGGLLRFDADGNLWAAIGSQTQSNDSALAWLAADTRDLRGKLLRIRPTAEGGYTIPEGNLFPPGSMPDSLQALTRPEIFAMGVKNPYSLAYDPLSRRMAWGDMGPDVTGKPDELNLAAGPGNFGFPYFAGENMRLILGANQDPSHPRNTFAKNTGLTDLPPAIAAAWPLSQSAPISGPIFRAAALPADAGVGRLPAAFDGLWFATDYNGGSIDTVSLSVEGALGRAGRWLPKGTLTYPVELRLGPDGALYAVNYGGFFISNGKASIVRLRWTDPCGTLSAVRPGSTARPRLHGARLRIPRQDAEVEIRDVTGVLRWSGRPAMGDFDLRASGVSGLAFIVVSAPGYRWSCISLL
jgi:cytochrome c